MLDNKVCSGSYEATEQRRNGKGEGRGKICSVCGQRKLTYRDEKGVKRLLKHGPRRVMRGIYK